MSELSLCAKIEKRHAEKALLLTSKLGLLNKQLEIHRNDTHVSIPLVRSPNDAEVRILRMQIPAFQLANALFLRKSDSRKTLPEVLAGQLPAHLIENMPRALDILGEIAIIQMPPELKAHEKLVGEAILETHKNVRTVLAKAGSIAGEYRLREYRVIAGEDRTDTVHNEYGCKFMVDIAKAYFSPRLSNEHKRVATLVQSNETVVDLFAGVGPFSVSISKDKPGVKVFAIDTNSEAVKLLKNNIRLNRVEDRVVPLHGDARHVVEEKLSGVADRVIMNLPEKASEFVDVACKALKPSGGIIHYYGFVRLPDSMDSKKMLLTQEVKKNNRKLYTILFEKPVRETAPYEWQFVLDAKIL